MRGVHQNRDSKLAGQSHQSVHRGTPEQVIQSENSLANAKILETISTGWWDRPLHEWDNTEKLLACGACVIKELRAQVREQLGYTCSAGQCRHKCAPNGVHSRSIPGHCFLLLLVLGPVGIAVNKMLAKLGSGMHKPDQQTLVPLSIVPYLMESLPIPRVKMLGGKLGDRVQKELGATVVGDILRFSERQLRDRFGDGTAAWLLQIAQGIDNEPVRVRALPKSLGCGKTFTGRNVLSRFEEVRYYQQIALNMRAYASLT